jgi:hypothetical protein
MRSFQRVAVFAAPLAEEVPTTRAEATMPKIARASPSGWPKSRRADLPMMAAMGW